MSKFSATFREVTHPRSLQARSLLYLVTVGATLSVILTWGAAVYQRAVIFAELEERGKLLARNLAQGCVLPMMLEDENALRRLLGDSRLQEDVIYVTLRDKDRKVVIDISDEDAPHLELTSPPVGTAPSVYPSADAVHVVSAISTRRRKKWDATEMISGDSDLSLGPDERLFLGTVHLGMSTRRAARAVRLFVWRSAFGTTFVLMLGGFVSFILFKRGIIRPLDGLVEATREVSRGHLDMQIERLGDTQEFSLLATAFNKMTFDLKETKNQLLTINRDLEQRVRERTIALEAANQDLLRANIHLKELIDLKSTFVSMVSHELRTPLATIKGFVATLLEYRERVTPEKREHFLKIVNDETGRLNRLIEELLDISRIQEGRIEVKAQWVNVPALVDRVIERYRLKSGRVKFSVGKGPDEYKAYADPDKVEQILVNLYDNALRFTREGGKIETLIFAERPDRVVVEVQDEGPGIPADEREKIFEAFYRGENETNTRSPGTGLGLTICRGLSEAMGGELRVVEGAAKGARFRFALSSAKITGGEARGA